MNAVTHKTFGQIEIKDAEKGEVRAIVATLNVVDKDREVILPGAIASGTRAKISMYGHGAVFGDAPVGKGTLSIDGARVIFSGSFFMTTTRGVEAFRTIKEIGPDQDWSLGYHIVKASDPSNDWRAKGATRMLEKLNVFEVSPVLIGAGVGTGTLEVKCDSCADTRNAEMSRVHDEFQRIAVRRAAFDAAMKEPQGPLALAVVERAVRWLTNGRIQEPPLVKFFAFNGDRGGFFDPKQPDTIYLSRGLSDAELVLAAAHEVSHWLRPWDADESVADAEAASVARRFFESQGGN